MAYNPITNRILSNFYVHVATRGNLLLAVLSVSPSHSCVVKGLQLAKCIIKLFH